MTATRLGLTALALAVACATPAPPMPSAEALVSKAIERASTLRTVHFKLDVTDGYVLIGPGLQVIRAEGDVARPDRLRVRARAQLGGVIVETELIHVDGASFFLNPFSGRWDAVTGGLALVPLLDPDVGVARLMRGLIDARVERREDVDGTASWLVRGRLRPADVTALLGGSPTSEPVEVEAVVGEDGLVRRLVMTGAIVVGETQGTVRTLELSRFDEPVTIEPPTR